jgi:hypothetical protein
LIFVVKGLDVFADQVAGFAGIEGFEGVQNGSEFSDGFLEGSYFGFVSQQGACGGRYIREICRRDCNTVFCPAFGNTERAAGF